MRWRKSESGTLEPGDTFEKYTVEKLLGKGGMGAVYLVRHNVLDSFFALKVLFPDVAKKNKQFVGRFIREAKLACKIKHPNLIAVHDAGQNKTNGMYYLIMDYVSGGSVRDLLKVQGRFSVQKALSVTEQIAAALNEAYKHNMVHRDIKPDNIMFTTDGTAKLADLGIAKSTNEQDTMLTMEASVFGTPAYMSPEQAMDSSKVDCRADIYSLGIVLFEMLSGQRPYRGSGTMEILSQVVKDEDIPDIRERCPQISVEIADLIRNMTAKQLDKRLATPAELQKRLHRIHVFDTGENIVSQSPVVQSASIPAFTMPTIVNGNYNTAPLADVPEITMPTMVNDIPVSEQQAEQPNVTVQTAFTAERTSSEEVTIPAVKQKIPVQNLVAGPSKPSAVPAKETGIAATLLMTENSTPNLTQKMQNSSVHAANKRKNIMITVAVVLICFICFGMFSIFSFRKSDSPIEIADVAKQKQETTPGKMLASSTDNSSLVKTLKQNIETASVEEIKLKQRQEPEYPAEDELVNNAVVILGKLGKSTQQLKNSIAGSVKSPVVIREAESFARYRQQLTEIIKSRPQYVILIPADRYAELDMSRTNFESLIRAEAEMLRDGLIPFIFVIAPENPDIPKIAQFNEAVRELCALRSFLVSSRSEDVSSIFK